MIKANRSGAKQHRRRGVTLVEFALVVPILLAMLLGIIEFGWMSKNHLTLANAAREGARAAALGKNTTEIQDRAKNACATLAGINSTPSKLTINLHKDEDGSPYTYSATLGNSGTGTNNAVGGSMIRVQLVYQHQSLTNFFPFLNRTMTISVVMRREA